MKRLPVFVQLWVIALAVCAAAVALSFANVDVPIARHFWRVGRLPNPLSTAFGAAVILALESAVALVLIIARVVRGHISRFSEVLALACLASICSYGINSEVLKPLFGVPIPAEVMQGASHVFNFMQGSENSSFPSGHMVLAGAFGGVFMSLLRRSAWPLSALLMLAAVLLVVGEWHFVSDVIAGTFVGISAGMLAGEAWTAHSRTQ